jgi:hypothetical protein
MSVLQGILRFLLAAALVAGAVIFASLMLLLAVTGALLIGGWLWWRTRHLRRVRASTGGAVIEGEFRVEHDAQRLTR